MKIISLNVENVKHLERVKRFVNGEQADVVCLMEACEEEMIELIGKDYLHYQYAPNDILPSGKRTGVMILSKEPLSLIAKYYCEEESEKYLKNPGVGTHVPALLFVETNGIKIGATHFSWTFDGRENERQERHLNKLLGFVENKGEFVLCGDFNIPRGYKLYHKIAKNYRDNIPSEITTTIDPDLHRANKEERGRLALVVDYIWSTPKYLIENVRIVAGVSDHCGVVGEVGAI